MLDLIVRLLRFLASPNAQYAWMRKNPKQYVALNIGIALIGVLGITAYDRWDRKKWSADYDARNTPQPTE